MGAYTILLAGLDPGRSPIRRHLQRSDEVNVIDVATHVTPGRAPHSRPPDPDVVVIGPDLAQPLAVAGLLRQHSPSAQVVFLVSSQRMEEFRESLPFVPQLADAWTVSTQDTAEAIGAVILEAARAARRGEAKSAPDPDGLPTARDPGLHEAQRRERQKSLSERFMATVLMQAPDPIFALNARGDIISSNDAAFRLFLNNPAASIGHPVLGIFPVGAWPEIDALIERSRRGDVVERYVTRIVTSGEQARDAAISLAPVRVSEDIVMGFAMTIRDITELRDAEKHLAEARRELAQVARRTMLDAMTASIAHEIRQPLAAVIASGEAALRWLNRESPDIVEARDALQQVVDDARRTGDIVTNIRGMFQHEHRAPVPLDMNQVVREVLALAKGELGRESIAIRLELQEPLPKVLGDRVALQQVLLNVIMNAADAMGQVPYCHARLEIRTKVQVNATILVSVTDNGCGIDPAHALLIFDAYYTTKARGMGMGLYICRTIIEAHSGRMWAAPAIPRGTTFQVELPKEDPGAPG
jgi:PAS domain S-box-containing protein